MFFDIKEVKRPKPKLGLLKPELKVTRMRKVILIMTQTLVELLTLWIL